MQQNDLNPAEAQNAATIEQWSQMQGAGFAQLTEQDFAQRFPQVTIPNRS